MVVRGEDILNDRVVDFPVDLVILAVGVVLPGPAREMRVATDQHEVEHRRAEGIAQRLEHRPAIGCERCALVSCGGINARAHPPEIEQRQKAKLAKDYGRADAIRQELLAQGVVLEDSREGTQWRRA